MAARAVASMETSRLILGFSGAGPDQSIRDNPMKSEAEIANFCGRLPPGLCRSVSLSVCLSVHLSVCLCVGLSLCVSLCVSVSLSLYIYIYIYMAAGTSAAHIFLKNATFSPSFIAKMAQTICPCMDKFFAFFWILCKCNFNQFLEDVRM